MPGTAGDMASCFSPSGDSQVPMQGGTWLSAHVRLGVLVLEWLLREQKNCEKLQLSNFEDLP